MGGESRGVHPGGVNMEVHPAGGCIHAEVGGEYGGCMQGGASMLQQGGCIRGRI